MKKWVILLLAAMLLGAVCLAEEVPFFENPGINAMIDANYAEVQQNGWAELVIPESLHHFGRDMISPNALDVGRKLIDHG